VGSGVSIIEGAKITDCLNQDCKEKDLHPVTARSYDGCCSPLCEEIMDHDQTLLTLAEAEKKLAEAQEQAFRAGFVAGRGSDYNIDGHYQRWLLEAMQ